MDFIKENIIQYIVLVIAALVAGLAPLYFARMSSVNHLSLGFPGWPSEYEEKELIQLPLTKKEQGFVQDFPGSIARFSDGNRELIIRWVKEPTRKLHPAGDCFKGIGYAINPQPIRVNKNGINMGCFTAEKETDKLNVCEYIVAEDGETWSDISSWYWGALFGNDEKGWYSYVIAEF